MRPQMPPTLCHSMRHARATADTVQRTAIHAAQSSNGLVKRDLGRAHGTDSTRTPCSGHLTRVGAYSREHFDAPRSSARHRLDFPRPS